MYELGIIGGMGPQATAALYERIIEYTAADTDQEHIDTLVLSRASIPDRTQAIFGEGPSPVPALNEEFALLATLKVPVAVIPCNTSHYFIPEVTIPESVRFINMVEESLTYARENLPNAPLCVLGTNGLAKGQVYQSHPAAAGATFITLTDEEQQAVMQIITRIKASADPVPEAARLAEIMRKVRARAGRCLFILACTELSLLRDELPRGYHVLDSMDALAVKAVTVCGRPVRATLDELNS